MSKLLPTGTHWALLIILLLLALIPGIIYLVYRISVTS